MVSTYQEKGLVNSKVAHPCFNHVLFSDINFKFSGTLRSMCSPIIVQICLKMNNRMIHFMGEKKKNCKGTVFFLDQVLNETILSEEKIQC